MMQNHVIYSDDPQAVEKLQAKLDKLTAMHARMKEINAYFRKHATALGCPGLSDEDAAKLDRRVQEGYSWEKQPYPSYVLSGNTAEMRRLRQRIEEVSRTQSTEYVGWDFPGGRAEADKEDNRLRLYFDEKPSEEQRSKLKCTDSSGHRPWAHGSASSTTMPFTPPHGWTSCARRAAKVPRPSSPSGR